MTKPVTTAAPSYVTVYSIGNGLKKALDDAGITAEYDYDRDWPHVTIIPHDIRLKTEEYKRYTLRIDIESQNEYEPINVNIMMRMDYDYESIFRRYPPKKDGNYDFKKIIKAIKKEIGKLNQAMDTWLERKKATETVLANLDSPAIQEGIIRDAENANSPKLDCHVSFSSINVSKPILDEL